MNKDLEEKLKTELNYMAGVLAGYGADGKTAKTYRDRQAKLILALIAQEQKSLLDNVYKILGAREALNETVKGKLDQLKAHLTTGGGIE